MHILASAPTEALKRCARRGRRKASSVASLSITRRSSEAARDSAVPESRGAMAEIRYCLLESAAGYALFQRKEGDEIASKLKEMQQLVIDAQRFMRCAQRPRAVGLPPALGS